MQRIPTLVPVVAIALIDAMGLVLMQRRPVGKAHAGLWEFPGGKVEPHEAPEDALLREVTEELGIKVERTALVPLTFASDPALPATLRAPQVILLYTCRRWVGEPQPLDADELGWFAMSDLAGLAMPPLDIPLAAALAKSI